MPLLMDPAEGIELGEAGVLPGGVADENLDGGAGMLFLIPSHGGRLPDPLEITGLEVRAKALKPGGEIRFRPVNGGQGLQ